MNSKISVLVPIYNAAKWLPAFVDALSRQRLDDAEFVFLDDCSTDNSMDVLDRELNRCALIKFSRLLRHNVNKGVSEARQTLLEAATGEYIIFADPDDTVDDGMYSGLMDTAMQTGADLVWEDFYEGDSGRRRQAYSGDAKGMISELLRGRMHGALWNKLIKREFIQTANAKFLQGRIGLCEDLDFICQVLVANPKIAYHDGCHYNYRTVADSATHGLSEDSFKSLMSVEGHIRHILDMSEFSTDFEYWRRGNRLAAFLSRSVGNKFFYEYIGDIKNLSGLPTNSILKCLFWMAARGWRSLARLVYLIAVGIVGWEFSWMRV